MTNLTLPSKTTLIPAVVAFLVKDNKVLLGERKVVSSGLGEGLLAGVGGKLEAGETADEALVRELIEEIGTDQEGKVVCSPVKWQHMGQVGFIFPHKPKWSMQVQVYLVIEWGGEPIETEPIYPEWFDLGKIPWDRMWKDNQMWLPKVLAGEKINTAFIYDEAGNVEEIE